jgi:ribosomal protein L37E
MNRTHIPCRECGVTHINPKSSSLCVECGIAAGKLRGDHRKVDSVVAYITQYSEEEVQDLLASIIPADDFITQQSEDDIADYLEYLNIRT